MKVYSWKTLIVTILIGGVIIIWRFEDVMAGELPAFIHMLMLGYLILNGFWVSFTKKGSEESKRKIASSKRIYRKLFGPLAFIAPWGYLILIVFAALSIQLIPSQKWLSVLLIIGSLVCFIVCNILVLKHLKIEEETGKENGDEL